MAFVWRTGASDQYTDAGDQSSGAGDNSTAASSDPANLPTSPTQLLVSRIIISTSLALGAIYFVLVVRTFARYGDRIDRRWREIVRALDEGRRELDAIVREGEERIKAIDEAKAGKLFVLCVSLRIHEAVRVRPPVHTSVGAASFFAYIAHRVYDAIRCHRQRTSLCDAVDRERLSCAL